MKKHCIRKHWDKNKNTMEIAKQKASPPQGVVLEIVRKPELDSIAAFKAGTAAKNDWAVIMGLMHMARAMANGGIGEEALPDCARIELAMERAQDEHVRTGQMTLSPAELQAAIDLYEYHDLQRTSIPLREYTRWLARTTNTIHQKKKA